MTINSVSDQEIDRAFDEGLSHIRTWDSSAALGQNVVGVNDSGHVIAIADIYGPWGVDITAEMEAK